MRKFPLALIFVLLSTGCSEKPFDFSQFDQETEGKFAGIMGVGVFVPGVDRTQYPNIEVFVIPQTSADLSVEMIQRYNTEAYRYALAHNQALLEMLPPPVKPAAPMEPVAAAPESPPKIKPDPKANFENRTDLTLALRIGDQQAQLSPGQTVSLILPDSNSTQIRMASKEPEGWKLIFSTSRAFRRDMIYHFTMFKGDDGQFRVTCTRTFSTEKKT